MTDPNALPLPEFYRILHATGLVRRALDIARAEDLGDAGDVTSLVCIPESRVGAASVIARSGGVIAGLAALPDLRDLFAPRCELRARVHDGAEAAPGQEIASVTGPLREILALERTLLNLVGRLSGIASLTARYARTIPLDSRAKLYDTRKTTPALRVLEKYAVRCGGGRSHRLGLHDAVLIKDNHLAGVRPGNLAPFVRDAATRARAITGVRFVEVEVDSLDQFAELLHLPPGTIDIVLLDNMTPAHLRYAARQRDEAHPRLELEASGGITLATLPEIASTGVDRISAGALTHQAVSIDVAMDVHAEP